MRKLAILGLILAASGAYAVRAEVTSNTARNILSGSPEIADMLPAPHAANDTVPALLDAATSALTAGHTGQAQEALEEAETRALDRSVVASDQTHAIAGPVVTNIYQARQALGNNNISGALSSVAAAKAAIVTP